MMKELTIKDKSRWKNEWKFKELAVKGKSSQVYMCDKVKHNQASIQV